MAAPKGNTYGVGNGRPTDYRPEYDEQAYKLALLGMTDKMMADFFEVAESTIYLWKQKQPSFSEALKKGKAIADAEIAQSLYKRAFGYEVTENKETESEKDGAKSEQITKHIPGDTTAMIFWLKNRQPKLWRDKQEEESGNGDGQIQKVQIEVISADKGNGD